VRVDGNGEYLLGVVLADHVLIEIPDDEARLDALVKH
jgi:hypothetical protein